MSDSARPSADLLPRLRSGDTLDKLDALNMLRARRSSSGEALSAVLEALTDPNPMVRHVATRAFARLENVEPEDLIARALPLLQDTDDSVVIAAIECIAASGCADLSAIDAVKALLRDDDSEFSRVCAAHLSTMGVAGREALLDSLPPNDRPGNDDSRYGHRPYVYRALVSCGHLLHLQILARVLRPESRAIRSRLISLLSSCDGLSLDDIQKLLSEDGATVFAILSKLEEAGRIAEFIDVIALAMKRLCDSTQGSAYSDAKTANACAEALATLGAAAASTAQAATYCAAHGTGGWRPYAELLRSIGVGFAVPALRAELRCDELAKNAILTNHGVILQILAEFGPSAVDASPEVILALHSKFPPTRGFAASTLKAMGLRSSVPRLP